MEDLLKYLIKYRVNIGKSDIENTGNYIKKVELKNILVIINISSKHSYLKVEYRSCAFQRSFSVALAYNLVIENI